MAINRLAQTAELIQWKCHATSAKPYLLEDLATNDPSWN